MRVSRQKPCPVCQKPDWCLVNQDVVLCMRVQSSKAVQFKTGELGWRHDQGTQKIYQAPAPKPVVTLDPVKVLRGWRAHNARSVEGLAGSLGVSVASLERLGCIWAGEHRAWAFPMRDGFGAVVGI